VGWCLLLRTPEEGRLVVSSLILPARDNEVCPSFLVDVGVIAGTTSYR